MGGKIGISPGIAAFSKLNIEGICAIRAQALLYSELLLSQFRDNALYILSVFIYYRKSVLHLLKHMLRV